MHTRIATLGDAAPLAELITTIAQDEATSAVYGMPKAAATINAAVDILSAGDIASKLVDLLMVKS